MEELILDEEILNDLNEYMKSKKYAYNTRVSYMNSFIYLAKQYKKVNQDVVLQFLQKAKNSNQIAIVSLLNEYCVVKHIPFYVVKIKVRQQPRKIPEVLSIEEVQKLVESVPMPFSLMLRCLFNIGRGIRNSDLVKLKYDNIDWTSWIEKPNEQGFCILKNRKRNKESPQNIPRRLMKDLYDYALERNMLDENGYPKGLVFDFDVVRFKRKMEKKYGTLDDEEFLARYTRHANNNLSYFVFDKYGLSFLKTLQGRKVHNHTMRHSRSTYLYNEMNVPLEKLQKMGDDASYNTTLIYAKINPRKVFEEVKDAKEV